METQKLATTISHVTKFDARTGEFLTDSPVIYGMLGRCRITSIETRQMGSQSIKFYKLEIQKPTLSRSTRQDPAIWVPVATAKEKGLRAIMDRAQAEEALKILLSREYYFEVGQPWKVVQAQLEKAIQSEGGAGLAKVASFLHVLGKRQIVPTSEVAKFSEAVNRILYRELSELLDEPMKSIEERVAKGMKHKLIPDS